MKIIVPFRNNFLNQVSDMQLRAITCMESLLWDCDYFLKVWNISYYIITYCIKKYLLAGTYLSCQSCMKHHIFQHLNMNYCKQIILSGLYLIACTSHWIQDLVLVQGFSKKRSARHANKKLNSARRHVPSKNFQYNHGVIDDLLFEVSICAYQAAASSGVMASKECHTFFMLGQLKKTPATVMSWIKGYLTKFC